jgi:hypothetical protein
MNGKSEKYKEKLKLIYPQKGVGFIAKKQILYWGGAY